MAAMTMPVRSVRVRAGIVELACIVAKSSQVRTPTAALHGTFVISLLSTPLRQISET